ncbi:hypothetical protein [Pseudoduganella sp. R-34]|uniref:dioxygenase family protein n=1 Tax=Pseudoduganella sp. R-34 TaxID=3404062 RepID=UPI003CF41215
MDAHDHGLAADLEAMMNMGSTRRRSLRWLLAGAATLPLIACGGGSDSTSTGSSASSGSSTGAGSTGTTTGSCTVIPEETGGPYPGDGTNSNASGIVNVLTQTGVVRSDIRSSFNGASGTAGGIPLTIKLKIVNANNSCGAAGEFAVYLWHCDREGRYSLYSSGVADQNYLRGVQGADANGDLSFTTIFPGCYDGRMPHAARALRGISQPGAKQQRRQSHQDFAIHLPDGDVERSVCHVGLQQFRKQPVAHQLCHRQYLQRWLLPATCHDQRHRHRRLRRHIDGGCRRLIFPRGEAGFALHPRFSPLPETAFAAASASPRGGAGTRLAILPAWFRQWRKHGPSAQLSAGTRTVPGGATGSMAR